jgi:hypothetical protein
VESESIRSEVGISIIPRNILDDPSVVSSLSAFRWKIIGGAEESPGLTSCK